MLPYIGLFDEFPPTELALGLESEAPGLLCAGADLSPPRLLAAYRQGIFPWFSEGQPVLWWSTHPRMVLMTHDFHLPKSLAKRIRQVLKNGWRIEMDRATSRVIEACAFSPRPGQSGTWIVHEMQMAYQRLAGQGHVHSVEVWSENQLLGGLYCVNLGRAVFGESMFFAEPDASKIALCALVAWCRAHGVAMIDCQQQTDHLHRFGARPIDRQVFQERLRQSVDLPAPKWTFSNLYWNQLTE